MTPPANGGSPKTVSWTRIVEGTIDPQQAARTPERLAEQRETRTKLKRMRFWALTVLAAAAVGVLVVGAYRLPWPSQWDTTVVWSRFVIALLVGVAGAGWILYRFSTSEIDHDIRVLEVELEIAGQSDSQKSAFRLFQLHQIELDKYYRHTLSNSRVLMWVGLACLAVGLCIVAGAGWWLVHAAKGKADGATQRIDWLVAALGAIGGILANYVAALYLKMHAATSQALNDFHNRLVSTHHLHFGNFLASKITTSATLEATLEHMAEELARR